ncbi:nodulation protein NOLX [Bradyrhizobium centrolobii]|uniref:Nodulation protein NOLX n=1 Tax=Bradyrhizobium centrolobii TaxID=1505087 RepID=A0A176YEC2_9BRAD|nr:HrpF/NolX family T3SS translocon protein [Bradyrhizobium centrolobii]OAF03744.1 nodulation protein NOLX [Bradyrhizobium centrolobii]
MSLSNLSLPTTSNASESTLSPAAWSALGPSAQTAHQSEQSAFSTFEAMLSDYSLEDKTSTLFVPQDVLPTTAKSAAKELEGLEQHALDLLPADVKAAIDALEQDPQPSSAIESPVVAPAPVPSSRITWNGGTLSDTELQIVAVLNRHKDQCPLSWHSLADKANDPSTPPDLKAAIEGLQQDPELFYAIGSQGDGCCGGKIKAKDLSGFSDHHSQVAAFQERQAQNYEQNYVPSDGTSNGQLSVMTLNDALRELYRYSDNLPKNLSLVDFKQIVDGNAKTGKCPPQVIAAAQYFLDHPQDWKQLYGGAIDKVHKEDFLQVASSSMGLTQTELDTLDTINKNQSAFFGSGDLTRDKLASMADDKSLAPKVKQAASQLLSDPLLFGLLNNSITGYTTHHKFFDFGGGHTVDSGNISNNDFTHFYGNMSGANHTVQQTKAHAPQTAAEQDAAAEMMMGVADQPAIKSPKTNGGALMHAVDDVLKLGSKVLDWAATAVGVLSFIPGLGELADLASMGLEFESQAANLLHTAISGGNMKKALEEAGLNVAAQAVGCITGPEVKLAMRNGLAKKAMEEAVNAGVNLPISAAQSYAENYLNNVKTRLEAAPVQAAGVPGQVGTTQLS